MKMKFESNLALELAMKTPHIKFTQVNWSKNEAVVEALDEIGGEQLNRFINSKIGMKI